MNNVSLIIALLVVSFSAAAQSSDELEIQEIMNRQEEAWNQADLEGFMAAYWKSDSLLFIGKNGPKYGWKTTLLNYQKSYPDKQSMGKLSFENLSIEVIGETEAFVIGKWTLDRKMDVLSGYYSLLWRKHNGVWKIVADHSS